ncbi:Cobalt-zinc-cadmium resistance protein [hydrothermal vent metagenome]|uniref:Cobalt-zinc-cadmium resistance protein n=1 Tax=hydrothermal vent metagenome TaxID=652676 RepID=A0A1W1D5V1_9ZZZZ
MRLEEKATAVSTSVAALLVMIKITVGILSGSVAILASAIDSFLDLIVSLFNYFTLHNSNKEADEKFHFGRSKLEPLAAVIEGTVISLSALFILYEALIKIIYPQEISYMNESIGVMIISLVITGGLVFFLNFVANKTNNMVIKADALHYKTDLFSNGAVLIALFLVSYLHTTLIDPILGIGIAIYMIYSAYPIIKEGILMLLDAALEQEDIQAIQEILASEEEISSFHDLKTREAGSHIFISVHIVFDTDISLYDAHTISDKIEEKIKQHFQEKETHILIHMDPYDDSK